MSDGQLCAFWLGAQEYALDIMRVEEILNPQPSTPVPEAPDFVEGVLDLRGIILPVVDLRRRLGAGRAPSRAKPKLLVCRIGNRKIILRVDGVSEVVRVKREEIRPAPQLGPGAHGAYILGVWGPPLRLKLLIDLKALLRSGPRA